MDLISCDPFQKSVLNILGFALFRLQSQKQMPQKKGQSMVKANIAFSKFCKFFGNLKCCGKVFKIAEPKYLTF